VFKLAELFVDISARDSTLQSQVKGVQGQLGVMGTAVGTMFGGLAAQGVSRAASAVGGFFSDGIKGAIEMEDSLSAVGVIFGGSANIIIDKATAMAEAGRVVKGEFINAANSFGSAFKGAGASQADAARLGNTLAELGIDLASFATGATKQEAFTALQASLRGEFDPLERFNVFMNADKVAAEALAMGLAKTKAELDDNAKKQATLSLIMKGTIDQQGDQLRSINSSKFIWASYSDQMTNLATAIGTEATPAIKELGILAGEMAASLKGGFDGAQTGFGAFVAGIADGIATVGLIFRNFDDIWQIAVLGATEGAANIVAVFSAVGANIAQIAEYIGNNWYQLIADALAATATAFTNFGSNISNLGSALIAFLSNPTAGFQFEWTPLLQGFQATAAALPEMIKPAWVSMDAEIAAAGDRIAARESARLEGKNQKRALTAEDDAMALALATGEFTPEEWAALNDAGRNTALAAGKKEKGFQSQVVDSSDFSQKLRSSIFSGKDDDTAKQQLETQRRIADNTGRMADAKPMAVLG
jgi:hypothetical protein